MPDPNTTSLEQFRAALRNRVARRALGFTDIDDRTAEWMAADVDVSKSAYQQWLEDGPAASAKQSPTSLSAPAVEPVGRPALVAALLAAGLLVLGVAPLPSEYYQLLRAVLFFTMVLLSIIAWEADRRWWCLLTALVLLIWNFLIPLTLDKQIWVVLDVAAAAGLAAMGLLIKTALKSANAVGVRRWHIASWIVVGSIVVLFGSQLLASDEDRPFCTSTIDNRGAYCD